MQPVSTSAVPSMASWLSICTFVAILSGAALALAFARGADGPAKADKPVPIEEQLPSLHLLQGPWTGVSRSTST